MKRIKLIYNPISGDGGFRNELDLVIKIFQESGYIVELLRTGDKLLERRFIKESITPIDKTIIVVAGGDGTVSQVIILW